MPPYTKHMKLYGQVAWFNFGTYLAYPLELFASITKPSLELGLRLVFWGIVAASSPGTISTRQVIAYFLIATSLSNLFLLDSIRFGGWLARGIKSGDISSDLLKPTDILTYNLAVVFGRQGVTYLVSLGFFVIGMIVAPPSGLLSIALFITYIPIALGISYGINVLVGTVAFYFTEAGSIKNVVAHVSNIFSGALIPLVFFPGTLKTIAILLPFSAAIYGPVQALHSTQVTNQMWLQLISGAVWSVVLVVVSNKAWRNGMKHYDAIGI